MKTLLCALAFVAATVSANALTIQSYDLRGTAGFGLLPGNEPSLVTPSTASGGEFGSGIFLDDGNDVNIETNFLTVSNIGWGSSQGFTDLTTTASASHIHGPTAANNGSGFTQTAVVLFNLTRSSSAITGGTFTNTPLSLSSAQVADLNNGKYYINIHTQSVGGNSGGELRGFIVPVPEASTALLGLLGGASLLGFRRRR